MFCNRIIIKLNRIWREPWICWKNRIKNFKMLKNRLKSRIILLIRLGEKGTNFGLQLILISIRISNQQRMRNKNRLPKLIKFLLNYRICCKPVNQNPKLNNNWMINYKEYRMIINVLKIKSKVNNNWFKHYKKKTINSRCNSIKLNSYRNKILN